MKKFVIQATVLVTIIITALALYTSRIHLPISTSQNQPIKEISIGSVKLKAEVADTAEKRKLGLGDREFLASDSGMLFIFPEAKKYTFWMKGVKFPLDFIWIKDKLVIDITKNVPIPNIGQEDQNLPIYRPKEPIDSVLELNAGFADTYEIKVGDKIKIE